MMLEKIKIFVCNIYESVLNRGKVSEYQFFIFGVFGFISYPCYYFLWLFTNPHGYENLILRIIASVLCIPLILEKYLPSKMQRILPVYWYFLIIYCMPFFFTFMLLKNNLSTIWLINTMSALVWAVLLVDSVSLMVIIAIGFPIGFFSYILTSQVLYLPKDYFTYIFMFGSVIIFSVLFSAKREKSQKAKLQAMTTLAASVAHELRTPFAALNLVASGMRKYFNYLVQGYELAKNANLPIQPINSSQIELLSKIPNTIEQESKSANLFIDLLLSNVNPTIGNDTSEIISISHCVNEALNRYPFTEEQCKLIQCQSENDFLIKAKEILIIHLLFNLLKNALYYLAKAGNKNNKGIYIWTEQGKDSNKLFFKDTGTGISKDILPYIFNRFFSKTNHGSGIGLTYCKMVMESLGGSIACESEINNYTLFIMSFPVVKI